MKNKNGNSVEQIKDTANIVDIVGEVVELKKRGANFQGLCPFHNEKTPSFVVSENKQIFTCFGCHASGDVIEFVKMYYNISFQEAVEKIANKYGIDYEYKASNSDKYKIYYEINKEAAIYFYKSMLKKDNIGIKYIAQRGLNSKSVFDFGIGYADDNWSSLVEYLLSKGFEEKALIHLGLASKSKGRLYDKFRNRIIFPIKDIKGRVIAFGGRAIGDDMPKYLNSPESYIYSKKNHLYGLNISKDEILRDNKAIVVEGYMDLVSLNQNGVKNVVASLGTALTENQGKLLKRYTNNVVLSYDNDNAGINAAVRGGKILSDMGIKVQVLNISDGKDPDDFINSKGRLSFLNAVEESKFYGDYVIENIYKKYNIDNTQSRVDFLKEVVEFIKSLSPIERDIYIEKVSHKYNISSEAINLEIEGRNASTKKRISQNNIDDIRDVEMSKTEKVLVKIILEDEFFLEKLKSMDFMERNTQGIEILRKVLKFYKEKNTLEESKLFEVLEDREIEIIENIKEKIELVGSLEKEFLGCVNALNLDFLKDKENKILSLLEVAEQEDNMEEIKRLTREHQEIQNKIKLRGAI